MKRRNIISILAATLLMSIAAGCGSESTEVPGYDPNYGSGEAPKVVSVWPEADATGLDTIDSVIITYDMPITLAPYHSIKVNTWYADTAYVMDGTKLVAKFNTVGNTRYDITVMKPTVHNGTYAYARDYTFGFTTKLINVFDPSRFNIDERPVNENATPEAVNLYNYLKENFGKKSISAAMANVSWNTEMADAMYEITGKYPAINCFDFIHLIYSKPLSNASWVDYTDTKVAEDWVAEGGIVACGWHWMVPASKAEQSNYSTYAFYADGTDFTAKNATRDTRWEYTQAMRDIDIVADYLLALQDKGIAVLWRPLHEASGNIKAYEGGTAWFWWGTSGSAQYKKLWIQMFNRFKEKGVNNVLWVWTSQANDPEWYPGDEYVDIIGRDYYENDASLYHASLINDFNALYDITAGKKIITLSECGAIPSFESMAAQGDVWSWFMPWYGDYTTGGVYNSNDFLKDLLSSEYVITRDEVPSFNE